MEKSQSSRPKYAFVLLAVLILLQLCYSTFMFVTKKQGTHSDEIWCYGLSNSYYKPFVYLPDGIYQDEYDDGYEGSDITGKWIDGSVMNDYITVQEGERFSYDSVYHNQVLDHHPPLYYFILHTICSFFPNKFSLWFSYAINLVSMAVIQIYIFRIVRLMCKNDKAALICCILYGGSVAALSTMMFLRQYGFMTMLITMIWYYALRVHHSYDSEKGFALKPFLPKIALLSFLLFFTNYTTCLTVGVFTACMCLYMLLKKRIKQMFIYGLSMVAALGLFCAAYPYVLSHLGLYSSANSSGSFKWSYVQRLKYLLDHVLGDSIGIHFSLFDMGYSAYVIAALVILAAVCLPLCILFRKEKWFIAFKESLLLKLKNTPAKFKDLDSFLPILFIPVLTYVLILPKISDVTEMGASVARYVFIVYPVVFITVTCLAYKLLSVFTEKHIIKTMAVLSAALLCWVNYSSVCPFFFPQTKGFTDPAALTADKNVLLYASEKNGEIWYTQCFPAYLRYAESVFITRPQSSAFEENTDGRNVDIFIAPISSFDPEGQWYERIWASDPELLDKTKGAANSMFGEALAAANEQPEHTCSDSFLEKYDNGKAKVLFCLNIQNHFYAVIDMDN